MGDQADDKRQNAAFTSISLVAFGMTRGTRSLRLFSQALRLFGYVSATFCPQMTSDEPIG